MSAPIKPTEMSDTSNDTSSLSPLKRALLAVKEMRAKLEAAERDKVEPIAIVGIGCRIPGGANHPEALWRLLRDGKDAIGETPRDRWDAAALHDPDPTAPGKLTTRWGGFLEEVCDFDPYFFGIAPREAACMDPQQRLLLEVAYEALEDAGQPFEELKKSATGVFVSLLSNDYAFLQFSDPASIGVYTGTGTSHSIAAGRLSFLLDLRGPSFVVDTACSSSLVAIHLACQSLRSRECDLALAGGANVMLTPGFTIVASKMNMMAADGRCKTFDAAADGFVRGEGCAVVALRRLSDALARDDRIWAVIRGSAVNQDGRTNGLTAPNGPSQQAVLRQALRNAGLSAEKISYVEAHGTGTPLGDPVEMEALMEVYGKAAPEGRPCVVGSIKTNVGHLEAAAGVAGLVKVALSLAHDAIPPHLHFRALSPAIQIDGGRITIPTELRPWPAGPEPRRAGVSSFGWSGTNGHLILEEAPVAPPVLAPEARADEPLLLPISAQSPEALRSLAEAYRQVLCPAAPAAPPSLHDVCHAASTRRSHHDHRLAIVARSSQEAVDGLRAFIASEARPGVTSGVRIAERKHKIALIFPGQGSQWAGMGARLLEREPVFRDSILASEEAMRPYTSWSLSAELTAPEGSSRLAEIDVVQPALFAVQVALAALWRARGIEPHAVVGHSMGEIAAACVAGALRLSDAARVVCVRSRLLKRVSGRGAMAAVELSLEEARGAIAGLEDRVSIAVSNSPRSTVLSGELKAIEQILSTLQARDVFCRLVKVDVASHSAQMDPLRDDLLRELGDLSPQTSSIPIYSTVTGLVSDGHDFTAAYWVKNLREPVLFSRAVALLAEDGHDVFVESSPHPILLHAVEQGLRHIRKSSTVLPSLRRGEDERAVMLESLGALYALGEPVTFRSLYPSRARWVDLPKYPWQHERFWIDMTGALAAQPRRAASTAEHALLGHRLEAWASQPGSHTWESQLDRQRLAYLDDHRVQGVAALMGTAYVEMALAAAAEAFGDDPIALGGIDLQRMLFLPEGDAPTLQLTLSEEASGQVALGIYSRHDEAADWTTHVTGVIRRDPAAQRQRELPSSARELLRAGATEIAPAAVYGFFRERGIDLGPRLVGLSQICQRGDELLAEVLLPDTIEPELPRYRFHPVALDLSLQALSVLSMETSASALLVPAGFRQIRVYGRACRRMWCQARRLSADAGARGGVFEGDIALFDDEGKLLVEALGVSFRAADRRDRDEVAETSTWLRRVAWVPQARSPVAAPAGPGRWLIFADDGGIGRALATRLEAQGEACIVATAGEAYAELGGGRFRIDPTRPEDMGKLLESALGAAPRALRGIVHLFSLDAHHTSLTLSTLRAARERGAGSALALIQALDRARAAEAPRLWLVTRGAQPVAAAQPILLTQSPLWGLGQVIAVEHPELRASRVDLDLALGTDESAILFDEIRADGPEDQIAFRGGARHVARLVSAKDAIGDPEPATATKPDLVPPSGRRFRLSTAAPGVLERLTLRTFPARAPAEGEVEIAVHAAGLNFLDVLVAMGVYPDDLPSGPPRLGMECAGTITALGEGVRGLAVGQEVVCFAPGSFGSHVITKACLVAPRPEGLRPDEAATLPVVFVTAHYALEHIGRLRKGERVLIHTASGGCGLAALQIAERIGAEVFATAGSPDKRAFLRSLGVRHVMDSRSLDFAAEVREITSGQGVDVILNTLTGEAISRGLEILRPFGRFVDISKRDIYENARLGLAAFKKNLAYASVNLSLMNEARPDVLGSLLGEVMARVREGSYRPLPRQVFPISRAVDAFHAMAQAKHTGKMVLSLSDPAVRVEVSLEERAPIVKPDATYLVTGGLSGLGLCVAEWMVAEGARSIVLVGRRDPAARAARAIEAMRDAGAEVVVVKADVSDAAALAEVIARVDATLPPLRGVIHSAVVLDDAMLVHQSRERFERVMPAKVDGAYNLHTLTEGRPLDFFVLFSSAVTLLGSAGQGNYTAANAFLDALSHHRRACGLPSLSIDWGPWTEIGLAAAEANRGERLASQGIRGIPPALGLKVLGQLLRRSPAQIGVLPLDVPRWLAAHAKLARAPLFTELVAEANHSAPRERAEAPVRTALVATAPGPERRALLEARLRQQIADVLRIPAARIDARKPLGNLGFDSLTALELRNRLEESLGVTLSATLIWSYPTMTAITQHLADKMGISLDPPPPPAQAVAPAATATHAALDQCTKDDVAALLARELAEIRQRKSK